MRYLVALHCKENSYFFLSVNILNISQLLCIQFNNIEVVWPLIWSRLWYQNRGFVEVLQTSKFMSLLGFFFVWNLQKVWNDLDRCQQVNLLQREVWFTQALHDNCSLWLFIERWSQNLLTKAYRFYSLNAVTHLTTYALKSTV